MQNVPTLHGKGRSILYSGLSIQCGRAGDVQTMGQKYLLVGICGICGVVGCIGYKESNCRRNCNSKRINGIARNRCVAHRKMT